jgi:superfamily II DNA or RNA helicase
VLDALAQDHNFEGAWWQKLLRCDEANARRALIESGAKQRFKTAELTPKKEQKILRDVWELAWSIAPIDDPLSALEQLEAGLAEIAREAEVELLPREAELVRFLESQERYALREAWEKKAAEDKLLRWLMAEDEPPLGARVEVAAIFSKRDAGDGVPLLAFELRATEDEDQRETALTLDQIGQLLQEVRARRKVVTANARRLLEWTLAKGSIAGVSGSVVPLRNVTDWIALFGREGLIRWENGDPVEIDLRPSSLSMIRSGERAPPMWAIAPSNIPLSEAHIVRELEGASGEPQLWVKIDRAIAPLDTLGMPYDVFAHILRAPEVPIEKLRGNAAGALLARRMVKQRKGSVSRAPDPDLVATVGVRPYVELRVENEVLYTVLARATAEDGRAFVRTHRGAWVHAKTDLARERRPGVDRLGDEPEPPSSPSRPPAPADRATPMVAVIPRAEDVERVDAWLARLVPPHAERVLSADGAPAFAWRADGAATLRLVRLWLARPSGVDYFGDGSFKNVVKVQEAPRLAIEARESGGGIDWLELSVDLEDELESLSLADIADALERSGDEILMLRGARLYRREHLQRYLEEAEALFEAGIMPKSGWQRIHLGSLEGRAEKVLARLKSRDGRILRAIERRARGGSNPGTVSEAPVDPHPASFLRSYQRAGVDFLAHASHTFGGALLADDMGLGKTLQTLSAITALIALSTGARRPSLVICPASVAHNWRREAQKFVPDLKVVVIEGGEKRKQILAHLEDYDLAIENFALVRRDVEVLAKKEFLAIAIDEAQAIKNPSADITQAVKQLNARHRIALTGTPIENRLTDLWSIIDFSVPGYLGSLPAFERMVKDQDAEILHKMLRARVRPLILRRLKREVTPELPERIEERLDCEMTDGQKNVYLAEVKRTRLLLDGVTDASQLTGEKRVQMLAALTRLRQICCEPTLVDLPGRSSGKIEELMELIPELLESGHKVLLFSQFVRMLELIRARFEERRIPHRILTGQTPDRMAVVDAFESDPTPSVFLISLKAGGTGLNLTSASHVVLFDPWWSPALEAQAIDRSHRIGQDKTVVAIRMVTKGTLEERILELQERKRHLSRDILEADAIDRTLSPDDFDFLLRADEDAP